MYVLFLYTRYSINYYMKKTFLLIVLFFSTLYSLSADMDIIKNGVIVAQKLYSDNETTLIVNKYKKTYICSVVGKNSQCILAKNEKNVKY